MNKTGSTELTRVAQMTETDTALTESGLSPTEIEGFEQTQSGGIRKWVELVPGRVLAGVLMSRQQVEDEEGAKVSYSIRLVRPYLIKYKNEAGTKLEEEAQPGEIVHLGERHTLTGLASWCDDGGLYAVAIRPHSKIPVGGGRTMWTFDIWRKVLRAAPARAEIVPSKGLPF